MVRCYDRFYYLLSCLLIAILDGENSLLWRNLNPVSEKHFIWVGAGQGQDTGVTRSRPSRRQKGVARAGGMCPESHPLVTELGSESPVSGGGPVVWDGGSSSRGADVPWDVVSEP